MSTTSTAMPVSGCKLCSRLDDDNMVQCDECDAWYHFVCVNVTAEISEVPWKCTDCHIPRGHNKAKSLTNSSKKSNNSSTSSRTRRRFLLQQLEEEHQLEKNQQEAAAKSDKAYIQKKYAILAEGDSENDDESVVDKNDLVHNWIQREVNLTNLAVSVQDPAMESAINQTTKAQVHSTMSKVRPPVITMSTDTNLVQMNRGSMPTAIPTAPRVTSCTAQSAQPFSYASMPNNLNAELVVTDPSNSGLLPNVGCAPRYGAQIVSYPESNTNQHAVSFNHARRQNNLIISDVPVVTSLNSGLLPNVDRAPRYGAQDLRYFESATNQHAIPVDLANMPNNLNSYVPVTQFPQYELLNINQTPTYGAQNSNCFMPSNNTGQSSTSLSPNQIAARRAVDRDLPVFAGKAEDWPLFISTYDMSTTMCGFSNSENLIRLQKCLRGKAKDAVRSRLLLPASVPEVINTLRMLFGKPETIIYSLLQRIRAQPTIKVDRFDLIIDFALDVQNICDTMVACNLNNHLTNPMLLQELIDRLPPQIKLSWAMHKQTLPSSDLLSFSRWVFNLARCANDVAINIPTETKGDRKCERANMHNHNENHTEHKTINNKNCAICKGSCKDVGKCSRFGQLNRNEKWLKIREHQLCRTCLKSHGRAPCKSNSVCNINGCQYRHHPLLHNPDKESTNREPGVQNKGTIAAHQQLSEEVLFRIIPVKVFNTDKCVKTFAYIDEGSSVTIMEASLAKELNVEGTPETLCLQWTSDIVRHEKGSERISFEISSNNESSKKYTILDARTIKKLSLPTQTLDVSKLKEKYEHLRGIKFEGYAKATPRILIGLDNNKLRLPLSYRQDEFSQLVATRCRLGWTVHGRQSVLNLPERVFFHNLHPCKCQTDERMHNMIEEHFALESFGVKVPETLLESKADQRANQMLTKYTKKTGNRFESCLLWKYDKFDLPDSYETAKKRLMCLKKQMKKDPELFTKMDQQIDDHVRKGYARKLKPEELSTKCPVWYLPIFAAKNPNKPNKFRMVFDAAAKSNEVSLNTMLLSGPDLLEPLLAVLLRFRENKVAISGDIKEMFHQVKIRPDDQHAQRFLWQRNEQDKIEVYAMQVMTFGATCSPTTAQYVKNKNAEMFKDRFPEASRAIVQNHYVDDLLLSTATEAQAVKIVKEIIFIHQQGGFEIRNWISNSQNVLNQLEGRKSNDDKMSFSKDTIEPQSEKILGMWWNVPHDTFTFSLKFNKANNDILTGIRCPTKREVLRALMSVFDPLGVLASFLIHGKLLLQDIWQSKIDWDDRITDEQFKTWSKWVHELWRIEKINIPRCYFSEVIKSDNSQLHVFVDASENAFAAVAYLRFESGSQIECAIVAAKTRVAPRKPLSIPRLELQAAILGSRLINTIGNYHHVTIGKRFLWSDSKTVLCWINDPNPRKFKQYVSHRISEILETTNVTEWRWVPTGENVADDATKRTNSSTLENGSRWFKGPSFLSKGEDEWPKDLGSQPSNSEDEVRSKYVLKVHKEESIISFERFSKWERLLRAVAYVHKAKEAFKTYHNKMQVSESGKELSSHELRWAEITIYNQTQLESYSEEINSLKWDSKVKLNKKSSIFKMSPYLDTDGLLRVRGRIDAACQVSLEAKRPLILSKDHYVTRLIVHYYHRRYHHWNHETTINEIRQKYAISKLRVLLKLVKNRFCQVCKNFQTKPLPPEMGDLPAARLASFTRPFSYVGVDYFGPMRVVVGRKKEKRWGMLITCMTIRAIHVEIVHSLTTDSCIMGLRNFIARRGEPIEIWSDNGTNFRGAANELASERQKIDDNKLQRAFVTENTTWKFIPPSSPHMGGSWERLVRSVKEVMIQVMPARSPNDELLRCALMEAERIVNSRPLTYLPIESEHDEALTPNHFLLGSSCGIKPVAEYNQDVLVLRKNWHKAQYFADQFWQRWVKEYLPTITRRTKWFESVPPVNVGDVVIIVDQKNARGTWPKGIVIETVVGKNGQTRSAVVKTGEGFYTRPVSKLAILDVKQEG